MLTLRVRNTTFKAMPERTGLGADAELVKGNHVQEPPWPMPIEQDDGNNCPFWVCNVCPDRDHCSMNSWKKTVKSSFVAQRSGVA